MAKISKGTGAAQDIGGSRQHKALSTKHNFTNPVINGMKPGSI